MVNPDLGQLDAVFGALADPTRRAIVRRLAGGPAATTVLAKPFAMSLPAVLKHLSVLERAGLVSGERRGRIREYRLIGDPMRDAAAWFETYRAFWESRLDSLDDYLKESADD